MSKQPVGGPRVFISYAQFADAHSQRVLALAQALRQHGIDVDLDQFHQDELLDWPRWCQEQLRPERSDWVLMVCTGAYRDRLERRVDPHTGKGAFWEGALIDDEIYAAKENRRFVPVLLDDEPEASIPGIVHGWTFCRVRGLVIEDPGYERLCRLLTRQPAVVKAALGPVVTLRPGGRADSDATGPASARPLSRCPDPQIQSLSDALDAARDEEKRLVCAGADTREVQALILDLRRRIRAGGPLCIGNDLLNGRYKLIDKLGQGGFATVFKAFDTRARRLVALKVLHGQYGDDKSRVERFFRGARKMAELHHQGIVQVIDSELADDGHHFFVMEYLPGGDFRQAVLSGILGSESALDLILTVGAALAFAHGRGIIHRDIKPANIVLDAAGSPKLTDFDLVRAADTTGLTRTGMLGTYGYAAPEMLSRPQDADARADVYGLGMTAIFALSGADPPWPDILLDAAGVIEPLPINDPVKPVLCRAVARHIGERYQTVEAFCEALRKARQATERPAPVVTTVPEPWPLEPIPNLHDSLRDGTRGPAMVWLPGGIFIMGQVDSPYDEEKQDHPVRVGAFSIGQYPVTFAEYDRFCTATGRAESKDQGWGRDQRPAINLTWDGTQAYCDWLSKETGETYRLATEAEWEYACRAGTKTRWCCGDEESLLGDYAWYAKNAGGKTHPVGEKQPNAWCLHDMHGNVWEWCQDWYSGNYYDRFATPVGSAVRTDDARLATPVGLAIDPSGPASGSYRVIRGGAWGYDADLCRSVFRSRSGPSFRRHDLGFRLSRTGPWHSYPRP